MRKILTTLMLVLIGIPTLIALCADQKDSPAPPPPPASSKVYSITTEEFDKLIRSQHPEWYSAVQAPTYSYVPTQTFPNETYDNYISTLEGQIHDLQMMRDIHSTFVNLLDKQIANNQLAIESLKSFKNLRKGK